jgi:hypothetical protein
MKSPLICFAALCLSTTSAWAAQATSNNFYPLEKIRPYVSFLGFDRDKQDETDLQTALQNSGVNWHCTNDAQRLRCPLNGDTGGVGTNVYFRAPHLNDAGATVSEFHVALLAEDVTALSQLQPEVPAVRFLGKTWSTIVLSLGKPTNTYDDGSTFQNLYCASRDLPTKAGEPKLARVYIMYINVSRSLNVVTSVEVGVNDQVILPLAKPTC